MTPGYANFKTLRFRRPSSGMTRFRPSPFHPTGDSVRSFPVSAITGVLGRAYLMNSAAASEQDLAKAVQWHQSGNLDRAIRLYEKVVRKQPQHAGALNLLGLASFQAGRAAPAAKYLDRALALNPELPDGHYNLGTVLHALGRYEDALDHHRQALAAKPGDADAMNSIGAVLKELGRYEEAIEHYRKALALRPPSTDVLCNLASALLAVGNPNEALALVRQAFSVGETAQLKQLFVACVEKPVNDPAGENLRPLLIRAMTEPWGRPEQLMLQATATLRADRRINAAIERADTAWPRRLAGAELYEADERATVAADPLLRCMLVSAPITDIALERFITLARYDLLASAAKASASDDVDGDLLRFWCAVAQQSFINGYIHAHTDEELASAQQLRGRLIAAAETHAPIPPPWVAAVAAYFPLHTLGVAPALLQRTFPDAVDTVITQQVREPEREAELRAAMPLVTEIDDSVSLAVQQQYEEMPSPRWVRPEPALLPMSLSEFVRLHVPSARIEGFADAGKVDVLVAGCGTGREPIEFASFVPNARILAVDLSLASLGYAKRKSIELGLTNIEYGRGDLLKLDAIGRQFDCITASGVLQCLKDPMHGWRVLLSRLRAGGLMKVRIYSEAGRSGIVAAQKMLAERGFTGTADDIRLGRQEIMLRANETPYRELAALPDLFNLGECRDLLFHVSETRTTLPELQCFIAENGLDFLGFQTPEKLTRAYTAQFPDDPARTDLDHWESFERDNPNSFAASYDFWVQKRGARH
jgi:tetratricopeptide (TPR) repeat protein/SAM-dependent methyltransferase